MNLTRRNFLKVSAASLGALSFPTIIPSSALGLDGDVAPSERIVMGFIGAGGRGMNHINGFSGDKEVQVVAVCDVDARHLQRGVDAVNKKYDNKDCASFKDFRELLARKDIDAVTIATPDHWHAFHAIAAAKAGKDIYCEKPLANSIAESRAMLNAVKKHKRILQTGSQERSGDSARFGCELVRNGYIGKLHTIRIHLPVDEDHHDTVRAMTGVPPEIAVPEGFDYDFWLGHAPKTPYCKERCHFWWRFIMDYGSGEMSDRGAHVIDIARLGQGVDQTGPIEVEAIGKRSSTSLYNAFMEFTFENTFADGVKMIGDNKGPRGVKFEGTAGSIFIAIHGGALTAEPASLLKESTANCKIQLGRSPGHHRNFLDCIKSREEPIASAEIGHRTNIACQVNTIAMILGRKLKWDPKNERFVKDAEANKLLTPTMRPPWKLS